MQRGDDEHCILLVLVSERLTRVTSVLSSVSQSNWGWVTYSSKCGRFSDLMYRRSMSAHTHSITNIPSDREHTHTSVCIQTHTTVSETQQISNTDTLQRRMQHVCPWHKRGGKLKKGITLSSKAHVYCTALMCFCLQKAALPRAGKVWEIEKEKETCHFDNFLTLPHKVSEFAEYYKTFEINIILKKFSLSEVTNSLRD